MTEAIAPNPKQQYQAYVERLTQQVVAALPISVPDEQLKRARARFRVAFSSDANGALLECTGESIARAIVLSAMSGLFPGGPKPDVWLIPRRNSRRGNALEVNWQLSFRGYLRLARRAGYDLEPVLVYEGEDFKLEEGNFPKIHHVRNLDLEPSWEALRFGYVRVFREGHREEAKIAYLTKKQIMQRRAKAQDQGIWNEWPLEMALKTLCHYAGNREMFPVDDPARYAMEASDSAELGAAGSTVAIGASIPPSVTAGERQSLPEPQDGVVIDAEMMAQAKKEFEGRGWEDIEPPPVLPVQAPPREANVLTREELVEEIRVLLKKHGRTGPARDEALQSAFGDPSWIRLCKLDAEALAVGLRALHANLDGLAAMAREPGED